VQLVSHKLGRLIVPYCLAALFISNLLLLDGLYRIVMCLQVAWYSMACVGWWLSHRGESRRAELHTVRE